MCISKSAHLEIPTAFLKVLHHIKVCEYMLKFPLLFLIIKGPGPLKWQGLSSLRKESEQTLAFFILMGSSVRALPIPLVVSHNVAGGG